MPSTYLVVSCHIQLVCELYNFTTEALILFRIVKYTNTVLKGKASFSCVSCPVIYTHVHVSVLGGFELKTLRIVIVVNFSF
jgi:hypothetical protein